MICGSKKRYEDMICDMDGCSIAWFFEANIDTLFKLHWISTAQLYMCFQGGTDVSHVMQREWLVWIWPSIIKLGSLGVASPMDHSHSTIKIIKVNSNEQ